ncbi:MAG TPA: type II toxin-antitoxin system PemK/MazF family toxin [Candidatus Paceibacterota bacterium]
MGYKKGQLLTYDFPKRKTAIIKDSKVLCEFHRVVVLHQRPTPYDVVLVAPITKASSLSTKGSIPPNYVSLKKDDYPMFLDVDSYINLDMIIPVDLNELQDFYKGTSKIKINATLNDLDLIELDYKIVITYELDKLIKKEVSESLEYEFLNVITFIDKNIKEKIRKIVSKVNDYGLLNEIFDVLDTLINEIKENYIKPNK